VVDKPVLLTPPGVTVSHRPSTSSAPHWSEGPGMFPGKRFFSAPPKDVLTVLAPRLV
jgi:hypothetical protein